MNPQTQRGQTNVVRPHCHGATPVAEDDLSQGHCEGCGNALFDGHAVALSAAQVERHVANSDLPVVVDFWAPWCRPCRRMAPVFELAAKELEARVRFVKVNTDEEPALALRHGIRGIPTIAIFKNGVEVARSSGVLDAAHFTAWVRANA